jgi:omega-amidase
MNKFKQKSKVKVGFLQIPIQEGAHLTTKKVIFESIFKMLEQKIDLILLPEVFLGGLTSDLKFSEISEISKDTIEEIFKIATKNKICLYGSLLEKSKGEIFNTAFWFDGKLKKIFKYRKIHLFKFEGEHKKISAGKKVALFKTSLGKVAPLVCYDLRFPEILRLLTKKGAEFCMVCAQWPDTRIAQWETLLQARAIENQMPVLACNRLGTKKNLNYNGHSMAIQADGKTLLNLNKNELLGVVELDLNFTEQTRKTFPFLADMQNLNWKKK